LVWTKIKEFASIEITEFHHTTKKAPVMRETEQRFGKVVLVRFTRPGQSRKEHRLDLEIAELAECKTNRDARRVAQKEAHAVLRKEYGSRYRLKGAIPLKIAAV
jgi:hypothetical protein